MAGVNFSHHYITFWMQLLRSFTSSRITWWRLTFMPAMNLLYILSQNQFWSHKFNINVLKYWFDHSSIVDMFFDQKVRGSTPCLPLFNSDKEVIILHLLLNVTHIHTNPSGVSTEGVYTCTQGLDTHLTVMDLPYKLDITLEKALWSYNFSRG